MKKIILIIGIFLSTMFKLAHAEATWDLRQVATANATNLNLIRTNKSIYTQISISAARDLIEISDRLSLLSGIRPALLLRESNNLNAGATEISGQPTILIDKPMYDLILKDRDAAAALLGHEMAHLYFKHGTSSAQTAQAAQAVSFIAGTILEIFFQRRLQVQGLGVDVGSTLGTIYGTAYSRDQEKSADLKGMEWALFAGFNPNGAVRLFSTLEKESGNSITPFLQTHPNPADRIAAATEIATTYAKYKSPEVPFSPELIALNKVIDEQQEQQQPKSEAAINGMKAFSEKDYANAKSNFELCAQSGEALCINNLGVLYYFGLGITEDKKKAVSYYKEAANKGFAKGMQNYLQAYAGGITTEGPPTERRMVELSKEAANKGSAFAMAILAMTGSASLSPTMRSLLPSESTLVNYAKAATMRGYREGKTALGAMYLQGYGVTENLTLAEMYLKQGSDMKEPRVIPYLYILYTEKKSDPLKSSELKQQIISQKQRFSQTAISNYYCRPEVVATRTTECYQWAKQAASIGTPGGSTALGYAIYNGIGTNKNMTEGAAWLLYAKNKWGFSDATDKFNAVSPALDSNAMNLVKSRADQIATEMANVR
jgi:TPR repeat protein